MKKLLLTLYVFLGILASTYGQLPNPGGRVAFPSPQAAQLGKFGGYSINHSTGSPNISIPVYTVKEGSLSYSISLSYFYNGFKPTDDAGWVGLGWTLSPGVITRSVRGLRDEMSTKGYLANAAAVKSLVDEGSISNTTTYPKYTALNPVNDANDTQPDAFSFQFEGYSGKFVLDETGTPRIVSNKKMSITKQVSASDPYHSQTNNIITKWTIVTEDGTKYVFGNYEYTGGTNSSNNWDPTAWYISEITNVKGNKITFEYTVPNSAKRRIQTGRTDQWTIFNGTGNFQSTSGPSFSNNYTEEIYLTKIKGSTWEVQFNSQEYSRQMASLLYTYSRKLNSIQVYNSINSQLVKQFDFIYSTNTSNKLQLTSFGEAGITAYILEYTGGVPAYVEGTTSMVDYWGYYNGQENSSLIPGINSSDLEPRFAQASLGALSKITYPTKGYTTIAYEQNDYSYYQTNTFTKTVNTIDERYYWWLNNAGTIITGANPSVHFDVDTRLDIKVIAGSGSPSVCQNINNGNFQTIIFQAGDYTADQILAKGNFSPCNQTKSTPGFDVTLDIKIFTPTISNISKYGGIRVSSMTDNPGTASASPAMVRNFTYKDSDHPDRSSGILGEESNYHFSYFAQGGDFDIYRSSPFNPSSMSPVYYKDVKESTSIYETAYKFTSHFDQSDIMGKWAFFHENNTTAFFTPSTDYSLGEIQRYDISRQLPKEVQMKDISGNLKQKTTYEYSNFSQVFQVAELYHDYIGKYDVTTSNVTKTFNIYYNKALYIVGGWPRKTSETVINYGSNGASPVSTTTTYEYGSQHLQVAKQRSTQSDGTIEETNYNYPLDYASAGNPVIQSMISANMVNFPLQQVTWMEKSPSDRKVINASLTTYSLVSGKLNNVTMPLPYKKFSFKGLNGSISTFQPYLGTSAQTEAGTSSYNEGIQYTKYDTIGNPISLLINKGDKISYLWAYKGQYPVAEILNVDQTALASAMGGTDFNAMADMTDSGTIQAKVDAINSALGSGGSLVYQMKSYQYNPLIGVSVMTDATGKSFNYEYDGVGRLTNIKNGRTSTGSVRSTYCYNYAGQNIPCNIPSPAPASLPLLTLLPDFTGALPVTLVSFNAIKEENTALLTWNTTAETNSDRFDIEHSMNGKDWTRIGSVDAKGESETIQYYSFKDKDPSSGENLYRLKMVDRDNSFAYSRIQSLTFSKATSVYPNPLISGQLLNLETADLTKISHVKIYDANGKQVYSTSKPTRQINLNAFGSGVYIVQITGTNGLVENHHIVKQ